MNRHNFILLCSLFITSCATEPTQQHLYLNETFEAELLTQKGQYKQAASLYQTLAQSKPAHQNQFNLLAGEAFVQSGDSHSALVRADTINSTALSPNQRNRLHLLYAQIYLSNGEAEQALRELSITQPYILNPANQIIFYQSLAFAYSLTSNHLQSVKARIELSPRLPDTQQQYDNNRVIINSLNLLSLQTLTLEQAPAPDILGGWMALTRLLKTTGSQRRNTAEFNNVLREWQHSFPQHPANAGFLQTFLNGSSHHFKQPAAIAIFLPESGKFAAAAQVIKKGFLVAYQQASNGFQPPIRFYDSTSNSPINLYQQAIAEGAELVIGPLSKNNIQTLALGTNLTIPVLALNHIPNLVTNNLFQFGLSPIDEIQQISSRASQDNHYNALLLTPDTKHGQRIAELISNTWLQSGNNILETQFYNPKNNDFSQPITDLLNLNESKSRYSRLKRYLAKNIKYTERRRQDVNAIFLSARTSIARSIYPQLRFYRATKIPVYAISPIYTGIPNPSLDIDLNNITFCDIPWLFPSIYSGPLSQESLRELWQSIPNKYLRLVALGIDAFNIIPHIADLNNQAYAGATGTLSINAENRVTRQLVCTKFVKGIPALLESVKDMPNSEDDKLIYSNDFVH